MQTVAHYRDTRIPLGPQIHLHQNADGDHSTRLHFWELFVLCHEIGHIFCRHLDKDQCWSPNPEFGMLESFSNNGQHKLEHEADIYGYLLLRKIFSKTHLLVKKNHKATGDTPLLMMVISLFDVMYLLGGTGSKSHPDAISRALILTETVYGQEVARALSSSYENHNVLAELLSDSLSPKIDEESFLATCH